LYYYGARYYDPRTSIWASVDGHGEKYPSWSPYSYTFNNPLKYIDPTGLDPECPDCGDAVVLEEVTVTASRLSEVEIGSPSKGSSGDAKTNEQTKPSTHSSESNKNDPTTPFQVGVEWLTGSGPRHRDFTNGDTFTEMLKKQNM
jgi:uncharacterized protein RhaS with RHS repeats